MARLKSVLVVLAAAAVLVSILFATGTLRLGAPEEDKAEARPTGAKVEDLGYLAVAPRPQDKGKAGLTISVQGEVTDGYVLYNYCGWGPGIKDGPLDRPWGDTILMDLEGKELHRWSSEMFGPQRRGRSIGRLLADGSLLINLADHGVARVDWDGNVLWKHEGIYHHDLTYDEEFVYVLIERKLSVEAKGGAKTILDHGVQKITLDGELGDEVWFSDAFAEDKHYKTKVARSKGNKAHDVFHANTIEVLPAQPDGLWQAGDYLTSLRNMNTVAVVSPAGEVRWQWGAGKLQHQHSPTLTNEGHIITFDNGHRRKWSRIIEVDPKTNEKAWVYKGSDEAPFYSKTRGIVQHLPSGNFFVVSSNSGRIFEVTREGKIVWEYWTDEMYKTKKVPIRGMKLEGELQDAIRKRVEGS